MGLPASAIRKCILRGVEYNLRQDYLAFVHSAPSFTLFPLTAKMAAHISPIHSLKTAVYNPLRPSNPFQILLPSPSHTILPVPLSCLTQPLHSSSSQTTSQAFHVSLLPNQVSHNLLLSPFQTCIAQMHNIPFSTGSPILTLRSRSFSFLAASSASTFSSSAL
jgi:hypothetical protein